MSMDMGSAFPFSIGWWCIVPDEFDTQLDQEVLDLSGKRVILPKNSIIRYREWYGSQANHVKQDTTNITENLNNKGIKLTTEEIAAGINYRERNEPRNDSGLPRISYRVVDPRMFANDGGPSHAERMSVRPYRIVLTRADNKRVGKAGQLGGWDAVRARLKGIDGTPLIYFMDCCRDAIRTLPALQHDPDNIEDAEHDGEDHAPDEIRYACMSRPHSINYSQTEVIKNIFKKQANTDLLMHDDIFNDLPVSSNKYNHGRIF